MNMQPIDYVTQTAEVVIGREDLVERLGKNKPLRIKLGVDPTRPDLHLGHMVVLNVMRAFQELGHQAILLIGDYTGMIGDPTGRSQTRPALTEEEVQYNAKTYLDQAFKILDKSKTEVRRNSEWFGKMNFSDMILLARKMTVAQMLERDDFTKRHAAGVPISLVEFLYPLMQGYDSVVLESDVELGGMDQLFNMLVGRTLQRDAGQPEQIVMGMPLLVGLDGVRKMSKSYDNYIAFNDTAKDMFGKIMSVPDELMKIYHKLVLWTPQASIDTLDTLHPMEAKKQLAAAVVERFYTPADAVRERAQFEKVFSDKQLPDEMPTFAMGETAMNIVDVLVAAELFSSKKEVRRLIEQGGVRVGEQKIDTSFTCERAVLPLVVQVGKRTFLRVV